MVATTNDDNNGKIAEQAMEEGGGKGGTAVAAVEDTPRSASSSNKNKNKNKPIIVAILLGVAAVIALSVGLGVGLSKNGRNNSNNNNNNSSSSNAAVNSPSTPTVSSNDNTGPAPTPPVVVLDKIRISDATTRSLPLASSEALGKTYKDCDDMAVDWRKAAFLMANKTIALNLDSYYFTSGDLIGGYPELAYSEGDDGSSTAGPPMMADSTVAASGPAGAGGSKNSDSVATTESSFGTNNQEDGVEEADVVLSDGTHIYTAYGGEVIKISVATQQVVTRTTIPKKGGDECSTPSILGMLLVGDRLVVFSSSWCNDLEKRRHRRRHKQRRDLSFLIGPIYGSEETQFTLYSTTNLGIIGSSQTLPGTYTGARAIGEHVYVVSSRYLNVYSYTGPLDPFTLTTPAMYENNTKLTKEAYEELAWKKANETVDEFIAQLTAGLECDELQQITLFQNTDSFHPYGPVAESIASVTAFNVQTPTVTSVTSRVMPTSYWQMYASADTLLLTAEGYWVGDDVASETYVLAYQLADATATPLGLGKVPGSLLNQFSMDEHNGYLRFATTIRERFRYVNGKYTSVEDSDNLIVILKAAASSGKLEEVGRLAGLGKEKEQIYSVRFLADRAFVVTYEQIDPLYTIDLKDPTTPKQVGELEIPGFSSYLHPIGADHILGVGQAVVNDQASGLQISLFDVSDLANPTRIANLIEAGGDGSSSDAQYDHKAFRLLENGLLILPVQVYDYSRIWLSDGTMAPDAAKSPGDTFDGFKVYHVNQEAKTITNYYSISHGSNLYDGCWGYSYLSPRSLVFGGDLWTLKTHTILIHDLTERKQVGAAGGINLDADLDKDKCTPYYWYDGPVMF